MQLPYDLSVLRDLLNTPDDIGAVLRGHLILEQCLVHKCKEFFPSLEEVYKDKLDLALSLKLLRLVSAPDILVLPCNKINKLRNEFAHGHSSKLTKAHISQLKSLWPKKERGYLSDGTVLITTETGEKKSPDELDVPRFQFAAFVALLQLFILSSRGSFSVHFGTGQPPAVSKWEWTQLKN